MSFLTLENITSVIYFGKLRLLPQQIAVKLPVFANRKGNLLLHDKPHQHASQSTHKKIKEIGCEVLLHPPSHTAMSDYHLFDP